VLKIGHCGIVVLCLDVSYFVHCFLLLPLTIKNWVLFFGLVLLLWGCFRVVCACVCPSCPIRFVSVR
jgi:hypothetical protein